MLHTTTLMAAMLLTQVQYRQCQTSVSYQQAFVQQVQPYNYAQQANAYVEKVLFLPIEREDPYYASIVHDKLRQEERVKGEFKEEQDLATQVSKLSESIGNLEKRFGELLGTPSPLSPKPPTPATPGDVPPTPEPEPEPKPIPDTPSNPGNDKLKQEVTSIFVNSCAKCHTGEGSAKGFVMFDDDETLADFSPLDKLLIDQEVYSGSMPKNAKPLDEQAYSKIRAWIDLDRKGINKALADCKKKGE